MLIDYQISCVRFVVIIDIKRRVISYTVDASGGCQELAVDVVGPLHHFRTLIERAANRRRRLRHIVT